MTNQPTTETKNRPTHNAYIVEENESKEKGFFTKIGAGWTHSDGEGITVKLIANPIDGRLVIRTIKDKNANKTEQSSEE